MQTEESTVELAAEPAPWTPREVGIGVVFVSLWMVLAVALSALMRVYGWDVNLGLFVAGAELVLLLPVWWFAVHKYRVGWRGLGLRGFAWASLGLGCGLMILSFLFNLFYSSFLAIFGLRAQIDLAPIFAELLSPWWLLLGGIVVAPVVEELFFRGFVFAGLSARYGWQRAALISSALFALVHFQPLAFLPIFILGLIFAYLYHRSQSVWPAILMHVSTNGLALGAAYLVAKMGLTTGV